MSTQPFNSDGGFSTTGNITGNLFVGNVNVTVWTADSAAVSAAKMTMRTQYGNTGTPVLNIEIMDIMMAKTYPNGTPVFT